MKSPVAPLVGAWIEIDMALISWRHSVVAPLVGAWIEMHLHQQGRCKAESLPLWERGLKSPPAVSFTPRTHVAPLVGAWIEILSPAVTIDMARSLPLWERGLKFLPRQTSGIAFWSLPLWERGLKSQQLLRAF